MHYFAIRAIKFSAWRRITTINCSLESFLPAIPGDDKFAGACAAVQLREREGEHNETRESTRPPPGVVRTMLRRDATNAPRGGPRIMYLEQEVEKIRRLVIINNPPPTRGAARIPATPTRRRAQRWHRFIGQLYRVSESTYNNDDKAAFFREFFFPRRKRNLLNLFSVKTRWNICISSLAFTLHGRFEYSP